MIDVSRFLELIGLVKTANATLIAVSKSKPIEAIQALYQMGQRDFGENRVQELLEKQEKLPGDIRWHLIGSLQKNKVNKIVGNVHLIHSVDSLDLAEKIHKRAEFIGVIQDVLLQFNISEESSKSGFLLDQAFIIFQHCLQLKSIRIKGIMTIGDHVNNNEQIRSSFIKCRELLHTINQKFSVTMNELSMGMSSDFKLALEEGSTMVRIGSALFGERVYKGLK